MLNTKDAARILGPDCDLTEDQILKLIEQLRLLALVVLDEVGSRCSSNPFNPMVAE